MATKTITIREEVYEKLKSLKGEKSFSELLEELAEGKEPDLEKCFGAWSDEVAEKVREEREKFREDFERDVYE